MASAKTTSNIIIISLAIPWQAAEWATRALFLYGVSVAPPAPAPFPPQTPMNFSKFDVLYIQLLCVHYV